MLNIGYMEFFHDEKIPKNKNTDFLKSLLAEDEEILFCFSSLRDRLAFFTSKRLVFMYTPDKVSRQLDFVHYDKFISYNIITSEKHTNAKLEANLPDIGIIGFNFESLDSLLKLFTFLSNVI